MIAKTVNKIKLLSTITMEVTTNPLLAKLDRIPGEMGRLPSHGIGYEEGVFDETVQNGDVLVFPASSFDEILLKTSEKLLSGDAIYEVFKRKIPSILNPRKLFLKDVEFLMTMLRKVTYGDELQVEFTHVCPDAKPHHYVLRLSTFIGNTKRIDPTKHKNKFSLPNGQDVIIKNMLFMDMLELTQLTIKMSNNENINENDIEDATCEALARTIESVDGCVDKEFIKQWLREIPVTYKHTISEQMNELSASWGMDIDHKTKCKDCGQDISLRPILNPISFFM